uniref:Putative DNA primase n=1 Tax=Tydemania expeditionis TaxID=325645 RepID=A0A0D6E1L0_TYDEX|nr:putative DNA primase [Tydemania expeditionis]CEO91116.1 putative DNA primase [Tydemania expeditionis]
MLNIVLSEVKTNQWTYPCLENAVKLVAPKFLIGPDTAFELFSTRAYIGFKNGVWNFKTSKLLPHDLKWYISGFLPFNYVEIDPSVSLQTLCPRLCAWIIDRANNEEAYINILIGFLLLAVLDVRNLERFLFLSGYLATEKSTYLKLLQRLVPSNKAYVTTSETISSNFGLQDLTKISKTLLICHDIGSTVSSAFVNLLRNLVSSGESQNVQRKFERIAKMQFEGVVPLASNKNPFSQQQRKGIIDRRMVYVSFTNRVKTNQIQDFDTLFPPQELERFASFVVKQDLSLIIKFIRVINEDYMVRQGLLESFKENPQSLYLQNFITRRMTFYNNIWVPLGSPEDTENFQQGNTLYSAYLRYTKELGTGYFQLYAVSPRIFTVT